jgi:hypothetical protein
VKAHVVEYLEITEAEHIGGYRISLLAKEFERTEMNAFGFQRKDAETPSRKGFFSLCGNPSKSRNSEKIFDHGFHGFHGWERTCFLSVSSVKSVVEFLHLRLAVLCLCAFAPLR